MSIMYGCVVGLYRIILMIIARSYVSFHPQSPPLCKNRCVFSKRLLSLNINRKSVANT